MKNSLSFLLILFFYNTHFAQYPIHLNVGNSWTYKLEDTGDRYKVIVVDSDSIINGKSYALIKLTDLHNFSDIFRFVRFNEEDSLFYRLVINDYDSVDVPYYKKNLTYGDTVHFLIDNQPSMFYLFTEGTGLIFGTQVTVQWLIFELYDRLVINDYLWTKEFGMLKSRDAITGYEWETLMGCVIDRIVYGDTTVLDVDDYFSENPNDYNLYQNYPNPFNPRTTISWYSP